MKTLGVEVWRASGLVNVSTCQEGGARHTPAPRGQTLLCSGPFHTCPTDLLIGLFICILYNILCNRPAV